MGEFHRAMGEIELEEGSMRSMDLGGEHVLLSKIGGQVYAVSGTCTHQETDLGLGFFLDGGVVCPLHLSRFDLKTGAVDNPPATVPLKRFNVKIQDATIFVDVKGDS